MQLQHASSLASLAGGCTPAPCKHARASRLAHAAAPCHYSSANEDRLRSGYSSSSSASSISSSTSSTSASPPHGASTTSTSPAFWQRCAVAAVSLPLAAGMLYSPPATLAADEGPAVSSSTAQEAAAPKPKPKAKVGLVLHAGATRC